MKPEQDYNQPVAYDAEGRPLYAHPSDAKRQGGKVATQAVHMTRPVEVEKPFISDATKIKHDHSKQMYPGLNLSEGEYVITSVRRHPIGLFVPLGLGVLLVAIAFAVLFNFDLVVQNLHLEGRAADPAWMILPLVLFVILVGLGTYFAYYVYINNRLYMTNECVIELRQLSLFNRREQSISLGSIEDASYTQTSLLQQLIGYGSIRLSTIGDETTYRFNYVGSPKQFIDTLNSSVEAFKNGRPVTSN